jgi:DNA-binding FadR family transcriptional regulator
MPAFLEFRCSLESEAAAYSARRGDPDVLDAIRGARERLQAEVAFGQPSLEADGVAFHRAIAMASGHRFLVATLEAFQEQMLLGIRLTRKLSGRPVVDRHGDRQGTRAYRGCHRGAGRAAARAAMADHVHGGVRRLFGR